MNKAKQILSVIFWLLFLLGITFLSSDSFFDSKLIPKWVAFGALFIILIMFNAIGTIMQEKHRIIIYPTMSDMLLIISIILISQSLLGFLQYNNLPYHTTQGISGSFDNPAGFAATLSSGFPFVLLGLSEKKQYRKKIHLAALICIMLGLYFSYSRAGIISIVAVLLSGGLKFITNKSKVRIILIAIWTLIIVALFILKQDSATGRILIWLCSLKMIEKHWLIGYGHGGFEAHYMDFQAEYLRQNPDSRFSMLADTVQYPFNEYLYTTINYGIIGLCLIIIYVAYMIHRYMGNKTPERHAALLCIISVLSFSMFSYPLMYPFVWFILIYASSILLSDLKIGKPSFKPIPYKIIASILVILACFTCYKGYSWLNAEIKWKKVAVLQSYNENVLSEYSRIYNTLNTDRYFLYNYAYALYRANNFDKANEIAKECRLLWADYDLEMLMGYIAEKQKNFYLAEFHYKTAGYMCPNRFMPLFSLMTLSDTSGDTKEAVKYAEMILNKPIKIHSSEINNIRSAAETVINKHIQVSLN